MGRFQVSIPGQKRKHARAKPQRRPHHQSQSSPLNGYNLVSQIQGTPYPEYGDPDTHDRAKNPSKKLSILVVSLSVFSFLAAIILPVFIMLGCVTNNAHLNDLFLAKLCTNQTYDFQLRVGYFGGCVSVANITEGSSTISPSSISSNSSSESVQTHCVPNMRITDIDDIGEEFWEDMQLTSDAEHQLQATLNATLPLVRHLQADVFYPYPPVLHIIFFSLSSVMLLVSLASSSSKRYYKSVLLATTLLSAFALALAFAFAIGSLQALNALVGGNKAQDANQLDGDIFIYRGKWMDMLQAAQTSSVALFYLLMGTLFVLRQPEKGGSIQIFRFGAFERRR